MYGCQNWQCSARDSPKPTAKKYKKTTYDKITNDGVQVENLDPTGLRKILLYGTQGTVPVMRGTCTAVKCSSYSTVSKMVTFFRKKKSNVHQNPMFRKC